MEVTVLKHILATGYGRFNPLWGQDPAKTVLQGCVTARNRANSTVLVPGEVTH